MTAACEGQSIGMSVGRGLLVQSWQADEQDQEQRDSRRRDTLRERDLHCGGIRINHCGLG
jgi:hypothetical protein